LKHGDEVETQSSERKAVDLKARKQILHAARWIALALSTHTLALAALAQSPLPDSFNPGANEPVFSLAVQVDGKILVGGYFTTLGGQSRNYIGRLNADGTLDPSFNPSAGGVVYPSVYSLALQADGKIVVGGVFTGLGGQSRNYIGRLNADGTLDTSFNPGASNYVSSLAVQADGRILVGGGFTTLGGQSRTNIGRLNADGTLDTVFNPGADNSVLSLAVQADGKILAGGNFTTLGGQNRNHIGRLNADGTLDTSFNPGADGPAVSLAVQADGKILIGGNFTTLGGQSRTNVGRLDNTGPATQSLTFDGSTVTWTRGGTSPEVWRTTFEYSPDGTAWTSLGAGIRIPGGWQLTGLTLPTSTSFRARGDTVGGSADGSSWFVETILRQSLAISDTLYSANGQFEFRAGGPAGQVVVIEASTDLRAWAPLQTNTLGAAPLSFSDPQATLFPTRFYRLRSGP